MTRKQLDQLVRELTRVRLDLREVYAGVDDEIAAHVAAADDQLLAALRELEAERDDLGAPVPDEASRVL